MAAVKVHGQRRRGAVATGVPLADAVDEGEEKPEGYCKSAYKAMRFAFLLKKRTGVNIDDDSLKSLSHEIAEQKAKNAEAQEKLAEVAQEFVESHSVDKVLEEKPKKARKPRKKAEPMVVSMSPEAPQDLIAFL